MVTIAQIVKKYIKEHPFLYMALEKAILNNVAFAKEIKPFVEKELGKEVKISAINMAIRRFSQKLEERNEKEVLSPDIEISMKSDLMNLTIKRENNSQKYVNEISSFIEFEEGDFLTVTYGLYEIMITTNSKYQKKVRDILPEECVKFIKSELCGVTIHLSDKAVEAPGLLFYFTKALAWENVNIVDVVSTFTELTFLISEEQATKAFGVLKSL